MKNGRKTARRVIASGVLVGSSTPWYDIAPPTFWVEADQSGQAINSDGGGGTPGDGDAVGYVPHHHASIDVGGAFIQGTTAAKPTLDVDGINGKPAWDFDGGDYLKSTALAAITDTQGLIVLVGSNDNSANNYLFSTSDEATADYYVAANSLDTRDYRLLQKNVTSSQVSGGTPDTSVHILEYSSNGTAYAIRIDNTLLSLTVDAGDDDGDWFGDTPNRDNVVIATIETTSVSGAALVGSLSLIAYYSTPADFTAAARQAIADKYGVTLS